MKKIAKRIVSLFVCLAFVFVPVMLVGCDNNVLSNEEQNALLYKAANEYYGKHTDFETFEDITYHWIERTVEISYVDLEYKNDALDVDTINGTFEDKTEKTSEYFVAIKKGEEDFAVKVTMNSTTVSTAHALGVGDVLETNTTITLDSSSYLLTKFMVGANEKYGVLYENSVKVGEADAVVTKKYNTYSDAEDFADKINSKILSEVNERIEYFFMWKLYREYYGNLGEVKKDGNRVVFANDSSFVQTGEGEALLYEMDVNMYYLDNKIEKADMKIKSTSPSGKYLSEVTFDYTNEAIVDGVEGDITEQGYEFSYDNYAQQAASYLPYIYYFIA